MLPNLEPIFLKERQFLNHNNRLPPSVSDWHIDPQSIHLPEELIGRMPTPTTEAYSKYYFSDNRESDKRSISQFVERQLSVKTKENKIGIFPNSTSALFSLIMSISNKNIGASLLQTPLYFSAVKAFMLRQSNIIMFHAKSESSFFIQADRLEDSVKENKISILLITDPIFCIGIKNSGLLLETLRRICDKGVLVVVDGSAGGFCSYGALGLFERDYITLATELSNFVYIDSPTKRLMVNGCKHALLFGSSELVERAESFTDYFIGSFSSDQIQFIKLLYSGQFTDEIEHCIDRNRTFVQNKYALIRNISKGTSLYVPKNECGIYTSIFFKYIESSEINPYEMFDWFLEESDIRILPTQFFGFSPMEKLGIRINLFRRTNEIKSLVDAMLNFEANFRK